MRRKKNLDSRLLECKDYILSTDGEKLNAMEAVQDKAYIDNEKLFGNANKVELEIGCGKGQFLYEKALLHPEINYIGVEKATNVLITAIEQVASKKLANVKFLNTNAIYLPRYLKPDSISTIYLNFSNPLPQKPLEKMRLTSKRYLEIYKEFLQIGGEIHQKTDDMHFFEFSLEQFSKCGFGLENISLDLHKSSILGNIVTEHERKFSDMGLPIYKLVAILKDK
jgi:tRNA (guanine-N7-)-methyltransferase